MQWRVQLWGALALASALAACDPRAFDALQEEQPRREPDGGSIDSDSDCEDLPPSGTACTADGKGIATCSADRASVIVTACPERELCAAASVQCACAAGLVRDANGVCLENQCGEGHVGGDAQSCAPALTGLMLSAGTLSPALALAVTDYRADVPLGTQSITLIATVPQGATLMIGEQAVASGEPWQSPPLQLGPTTFALVVSETAHPSRSYSVVVVRGKQETYVKSGTTTAADGFGFAAAVSGDTLVVGAPAHTE